MADADESHLVRERREKAARLRASGIEPYPWEFPDRISTGEVRAFCAPLAPGSLDEARTVRVAGRLKIVRQHGRSAFLDLEDRSGAIQLFARVDELGEEGYRDLLASLDPGDIIGAEGHPLVTKRGEPSVRVARVVMLAKAIAPPPEKFHGLKDAEERMRRRYVDLLSSRESLDRFTARTRMVRALRDYLDGLGFLEVETATLVPVAGGAAAAPFVTHSNYLEGDLQLRIALELALKRLLVGGMERVYEVGHCFRNEDLDTTHSPEFSMLELYWAYADYTDMRKLIEGLFQRLADVAAQSLPEVSAAREAPEFFRPPFATVDYVGALEERGGIPDLLGTSREELRRLARGIGATVPDDSPKGKFMDKLFEHYVEPTLTRPTFVLDFPAETTPLAKRHRSRPGRVERFELFARGYELGNAYTELNDPDEQEARFREQLSGRGEDHYALDMDFIEALRYGMPPATGYGGGIERLVMAILGIPSIKDVILFPPIRRRENP